MNRGGFPYTAFASAFLLCVVLSIVAWAVGGPGVGGLARDLTLLAFVPIALTTMRKDGEWKRKQVATASLIWVLALAHLANLAWPRTVSTAPQIRYGSDGAVLWSEHTVGVEAGANVWFARVEETGLMRLGAKVGLTSRESETFRLSNLIHRVPVRAESGTRILDDWLRGSPRYQLLRPVGEGPFPVVVFLHGHGGLFDAYARVLEQLVAERGVAVLLPAFGFGHWDSPRAADHLRSIVEDARHQAPLTEEPWTLCGLSAGGRGAWVQAATAADQLGFEIGRVVVISAPVPGSTVQTPACLTIWVAGQDDERIEIDAVRQFLAPRMDASKHLTLEVLEATHLLMLEQMDTVFQLMVLILPRKSGHPDRSREAPKGR